MPAGVHNGITIIEPERSQIVVRLAHGESVQSIADDLGHHAHTIKAIKEIEWQRVEARKPIIAAQAERIATKAADRISAKLDSNDDIPLNVLVPVFGVAIDKIAILRGENVSTVRHLHSIELSDTDLVAFAVARSKTANARVIEQPALQYPTTADNETAPCSIAPGKVGAPKGKRRSKRSAMDSKSTVSPGKT